MGLEGVVCPSCSFDGRTAPCEHHGSAHTAEWIGTWLEVERFRALLSEIADVCPTLSQEWPRANDGGLAVEAAERVLDELTELELALGAWVTWHLVEGDRITIERSLHRHVGRGRSWIAHEGSHEVALTPGAVLLLEDGRIVFESGDFEEIEDVSSVVLRDAQSGRSARSIHALGAGRSPRRLRVVSAKTVLEDLPIVERLRKLARIAVSQDLPIRWT